VDDFGQPIIPSTVPGRCSFLDLDNPAVTTSQTRHSMHAMSLKARLGVKTTPEDLRRNSVADLSHQSSYLINLLRGNASAKLEPSVRHTMASFTKNVTEMYGGGGNVSTWGLPAESSWIRTRAQESEIHILLRSQGQLQSYPVSARVGAWTRQTVWPRGEPQFTLGRRGDK
jgi:hypothetical protein